MEAVLSLLIARPLVILMVSGLWALAALALRPGRRAPVANSLA
jgi:hypothetical protein